MLLQNITGFPATAFRQFDPAGSLECIVAARARFALRLDAPMIADDEQPDLQWEDLYAGDPHTTPLLRSTDLTPFRPGTDVSVLGSAHVPGNQPAAAWTCGIRIGDRLDRILRVTGPRRWVVQSGTFHTAMQRTRVWGLTEPEPAHVVPLDWTLAHGGATLGLRTDATPRPPWADNPLGMGAIDPAHSTGDREYPAPQIEWDDAPIQAPGPAGPPAGFGLVPPWWPVRLRHAGTYDEAWRDKRHPMLPEDFDDRFWQAAAPGMVVEPWLAGDETFALTNLHPDYPALTGALPCLRLVVRVHGPDKPLRDHELALDSIQFDLRPGLAECQITWRARLALPDAALARLVLRTTGMDYRRHLRAPRGITV